MKLRYFSTLVILLVSHLALLGQQIPAQPQEGPRKFEVGKIEVTGAQYTNPSTIKDISGFQVGKQVTIPGEDISKAIKNLWKLRLFTDVQIFVTGQVGDVIDLEIQVEERPRLVRREFVGVKKGRRDDLRDEVRPYLFNGAIVTEDAKLNAREAVRVFYEEKGYLDAKVDVTEVVDEKVENGVILRFEVDRGEKVKIQDILIKGNTAVKDKKLRKKMSNTKRKRKLFASSKLVKEEYEEDLKSIIAYYNTIGYRDARITSDSFSREADGDLLVHITVDEGRQYFFRDITFKGNSIYTSEYLTNVLGINPGDVYNEELLQTRLSFSQDGRDVSSLYLDNGYLFFRVDPVETAIDGDSIDQEMRSYEGPQATIEPVTIAGNDRTSEHVIRRELRTRPGQKFSRTDIIRSQREIINLGYFNPEALGINTPVNPQRGTVDIEYTVEERPSDQLELSAGWGGRGRGVIGTLGVTFNNFSMRNFFNKEAWKPVPTGDGQRLSVRAQTNGRVFQSYNASFTEPWLGGKKPTSFTVAAFYSRFTNGVEPGTSSFQKLDNLGLTLSIGTRLRWPDDFFVSSTSLTLQNYSLDNWQRGGFILDDQTAVTQGSYNNFAIKQTFARNSVTNPIFPQSGSNISLTVSLTPPYSIFDGADAADENETLQERYRYLEYHKWRFNAEWYAPLFNKLVLKTSMKFGLLGYYSEELRVTPFERFEIGGDGIANQFVGIAGRDILALRGYETNDLPANQGGATIFNKMTVEVRYPFSLNPNSTIYALAFFEGGNAWDSFAQFDPLDLRRSTGLGLRVFLPMFGTLGFDYGIGFDKELPVGSSLTDYGRFSIVLGFEPE